MVGLWIGLLSLNTLSSCVATRQSMGKNNHQRTWTLGNIKRAYHTNPTKIVGGAVIGAAGMLGAAGMGIYSFANMSSVSNTTEWNSTNFMTTPLYNLSMPGTFNATEVNSSPHMAPTLATKRPSLTEADHKDMKAYIKDLIRNKIDLNAQDRKEKTVLMDAIINNNEDVVKFLINRNVDLNLSDENGNTALMYAIKYNQLVISKLLINKKANLNSQNNTGSTALMYAVGRSETEIVKLLINSNADVNAKDYKGRTALMFAVIKNRKDIINLLINGKADLNVKDAQKRTALIYAKHYKATDIEELLLKKGANPHV